MTTSKKNYLLLLSFLEGAAVMACELIGAKLLAPFFGTSLYVWASALALTLGGLTLGYFTGGKLSKKYAGSHELLYWVIIIAGLLLMLMPFSSELIMNTTINLSLEAGAICSLAIFMLPPLMFMGMVSPIIINLLTQEVSDAGNNAGNVYAISTVGGIIATFLMGFYVIPNFGLTMPAVLTGFLLTILPIASLLFLKNKKVSAAILLLAVTTFLSLSPKNRYTDEYKILYQSEGILGQVKVVDHPSYLITPDNKMGRGLIVNNTLQTYVGLDNDMQYSIWSWAHYFPTAASVFPKGSKVLLLGLGGGTLVKQLHRLGFETDVVEIDKRIRDVSFDYFNLDRSTNVIIDDARHYVRITDKKYDIVIFDTFLSESVPEHLITIEGFEDTKKIMNPGGMIMINFYGFIKGEKGLAARCVYKTLLESGFVTEILATPGEESSRNLIFLASLEEKDFSIANYKEPNFEKIDALSRYFLSPHFIKTDNAKILSDRKPQLAKIYTKAAKEWKKSYNDYYRKYFIKE
ncbi:MAG: putative membrane-bound spermidine synthase [Saprospiraceae bacterium]|jgi:predicted membrane-bound spermidine synthase